MSFRIRPSKFRHVYGEPAKKNNSYENIRVSKNAQDNFSCVNPKFLAVIIECQGGGAFQVIPLEKVGRVDLDWGKVSGHSGPVLDIKFDPFNDNVIASASEDCTVKLWHIQDGGARETRDCLVTLQGHSRRVVQIEWHPTAENVLLSAGNESWVIVWDVSRGEAIRIIDCHKDVVSSMGFSLTGDYIATTCRDLQIRLIEPRMAKVAQITPGHAGCKASKLAFLTNRNKLFTTGFSKFNERQYAVWDVKNLAQPLKMDNLDSSNGITFPYYDPDTSVVYLAGRGDGNIRYYEIVDTFPALFYLSQYQSSTPQRSLCAMPKRGLNVTICEIYRFYKLYATKNYIEPISMIAPRKFGQGFHEDLFPDTAGPCASMSVEEWLQGANVAPVMISLKARDSLKTNKPVVYKANQLITSDHNNELKFRFIADSTSVDYRPLAEQKQHKAPLVASVNGDMNNRAPNSRDLDKRRSLVLDSPSFDSGSRNGSKLSRTASERWSERPYRFSLQEEPAVPKYEDGHQDPAAAVPCRRTFKKLQRIWDTRQYSLDVHPLESPVGQENTTFGSFGVLDESPENAHNDTLKHNFSPVSAMSEGSLAEVATDGSKSADMDAKSEEKSDKENREPEPSVSQMAKICSEQKEKIIQLERALRLKDEENARLLAEIKILKELHPSVVSKLIETFDPTEISVDGPEIVSGPRAAVQGAAISWEECGTSES